MCFIVGSTLSPVIAAPFVTSSASLNATAITPFMHSDSTADPRTDPWLAPAGECIAPLLFGVAAYSVVVSVATIVIALIFSIHFSAKPAADVRPASTLCETIFVYFICTALMMLGGAAFTSAMNFTNYYVVVMLERSAKEGILANTFFSGSVAAMAILGIFTMIAFGYKKNLYSILVLMLTATVLLLTTGGDYLRLCVGLSVLGASTAYLFAPIFCWGAERIENVTSLSAWIQNGFTLAEISFPFLVGITIDLTTDMFLYWLSGLCVMFSLLLLGGELLIHFKTNYNIQNSGFPS